MKLALKVRADIVMDLEELEKAVAGLSPDELDSVVAFLKTLAMRKRYEYIKSLDI